MPLQFECPACKSMLRVGEDSAGRRGKCPDCGAPVTVPQTGRKPLRQISLSDIWPESAAAKASARDTDKLPLPTQIGSASMPMPADPMPGAADQAPAETSRLLSEATPQEMLRELFRRRTSAVLVQFSPPQSGNYKLADQPEVRIRCLSTQDMDAQRLRDVLESLGPLTERGQGADLSASEQPFELKGDRLGMSLIDFKRKYGRPQGSSDGMVWSSENSAGRVEPDLRSEAWHAAAGIIHCRVDLPVERIQPTIAGVPMQLLLYQFVDGRLFRISAYFDTDQFHVISDAMHKKYGDPTSQISQPRQLEWRNRVSVIVLARGGIRPPMPSMLQFVHLELLVQAESRAPRLEEDI